jgi:hypothetical protein
MFEFDFEELEADENFIMDLIRNEFDDSAFSSNGDNSSPIRSRGSSASPKPNPFKLMPSLKIKTGNSPKGSPRF